MGAQQFDWEGSAAAAWRAFQARLADHLAEMAEDDLLLLEVESGDETDGAAPYVQFCAWGAGQLRCEAVSNHYLAKPHRLDKAGRARLRRLGFQPPDRTGEDEVACRNYWVDLDSAEADRLAVIAVRALRDVYGVPHPALLSGNPLDEEDVPTELVPGDGAGDAIAVYPRDGFEQLQQVVDEALTPWLGHPPVHDDDGDIPIDCGQVAVFVRVLPDKPVVRLFACVARDVDDPVRAASEVAILNRERVFFKFLLLGDAIVMHADLSGWPFVDEHLRDLAGQMCSSVGQIHDDLAVRLAKGSGASGEGADALPPAMRTLLELEAEMPGSVDARLAAAICEHDRDLVLALLAWSQDERTTALLRATLRLIVERQAARYERDRSGRASGGRTQPTRLGRRVPDPTLEEVDPEIWNR